LVTAHRDRVERKQALPSAVTPIAVDQPETMVQTLLATEAIVFRRLFTAIALCADFASTSNFSTTAQGRTVVGATCSAPNEAAAE
jgi:hypothetical protein